MDSLFRTPAVYIGLTIGAVVPAVVTHDITKLYGGLAFMGIVIVCRMLYLLERIHNQLWKTN